MNLPHNHFKLAKKKIIILGSWGCQWWDIQLETCVVQVGGREKAKRNTAHEAPHGVQIIYKKACETAPSHCINNIWIEMEAFQLFNKQPGTFLTPSGFSVTHLPQRPQMIDSWRTGTVTVSLFAFLDSFSSFLPHKGEKIGKGQWEGATVLSTASLRKKAFSAGRGDWSVRQEHLGSVCLGLRRGSGDPSPSFPSCALAEPQALSSSPPLPRTACLPAPSSPPRQQEEDEAGPGEEGTEEVRHTTVGQAELGVPWGPAGAFTESCALGTSWTATAPWGRTNVISVCN